MPIRLMDKMKILSKTNAKCCVENAQCNRTFNRGLGGAASAGDCCAGGGHQ